MNEREQLFAIIGAAVLAVGSMMEWATVSAGIFSRSVSGMDGDGKITLGCGIVAGLLLMQKSSGAVWIGVVVAGIGGAAAGYDAANLTTIGGSSDGINVSASIGIGLVACIAGGVTAVVAGSAWARKLANAPLPIAMLPAGAGWMPDPLHRFELRWWDGAAWTASVSTAGREFTDPLPS